MTPMVKDFGKCGCGRSETGFCNGSHALTIEEYTRRLMGTQPEFTLMPEASQDNDSKQVPYAST
jgi:hypothetical protein